ncbi:MAG: putative lipid II flippase FtsW [Candidatus Omnitrophica bacterium]|nr:putative lipid II flippase FtsW [Candidatus Omnitrophota bacterium]
METTNRNITIIVAALIGVGLLMVYSSSGVSCAERMGDEFFFFRRQIAWLGIGLVMLCIGRFLKYQGLPRLSRPFLLFSIISLFLVFIPQLGHQVGGQYRWVKLGRFSFQPSEIAKFALIFYAADFISRKKCRYLKEFLPLILSIVFVVGMIILQPDFGTAIIIATLGMFILFIAGLKLQYLLMLLFMAVPGLIYLIMKAPYRLNRILVFLHPEYDPSGAGYQVSQAFIALGSGGFLGRGLGAGRQKLMYLPAAHTDFIFAIIGEELGFLGTITIVILFISLLWQGIKVARFARDSFGYYLAMGITFLISIQAMLNMGVVSGLFPNKGTPLPFISFGGSSLIVNLFSIGILLNISKHGKTH